MPRVVKSRHSVLRLPVALIPHCQTPPRVAFGSQPWYNSHRWGNAAQPKGLDSQGSDNLRSWKKPRAHQIQPLPLDWAVNGWGVLGG